MLQICKTIRNTGVATKVHPFLHYLLIAILYLGDLGIAIVINDSWNE